MRAPRWYLALLVTALTMAVALALVSAHIRLVNSGLGCTDWPQCYGQIGAYAADGATRTHRVLASALGLVVLVVAGAALWPRMRFTNWGSPVALLLVMIGLAVLGNWSSGLLRPGVVLANFTGGIVMAALLWWMLIAALRTHALPPPDRNRTALHGWSVFAIGLLFIQILLGGLVSAFFAALACGTSPTCGGSWMPGLPWTELSALAGQLELDASGRVIVGDTLAGLHMSHRLLGFALVPVLGRVAWLFHRDGRSGLALTIAAITLAEIALGVVSVQLGLPAWIVLAHYALALALLLLLLGEANRFAAPARHGVAAC